MAKERKKSKFFEEFKKFILRGNVMDMAVGVIVGGAFTAIVNSLVEDIITPVIGLILGGLDFTGISIQFRDTQIMIGNFIQAVIMFLLTAFVIFSVMKAFNSFKKKEEEVVEEAPAPEVPQDIQLLTEIRDLLKEEK